MFGQRKTFIMMTQTCALHVWLTPPEALARTAARMRFTPNWFAAPQDWTGDLIVGGLASKPGIAVVSA
ncbi:hypothetical protein C5F48_13465 [Cereibacter changlensis JA139]|uniref:Uncharacterized protein n=3 Tax=Cereibacter changlensis TaxID=402884 RepID=A0A2T4JTK1_9RHOB|nr:hypothetical protein C5F48_13465 [Cereibacter changlensis JA139]PZX54237.1 hypothetical protein LX76_01881 [Cereibacter changlensis]